MNVVSLFDGASCGRLALKRAGIKVNNYYASEIDKHAKVITQNNWPQTFQLGDINNWRNWGFDFGSIDLIIAGFPCQAWSGAGKKGGIDDPRGQLALVLIEIWDAIKKENPNVKVLFENVKMKNEHIKFINELFGMEPIEINSINVSAQDRKRLYWTNIKNVKQPKNKNIKLTDILMPGNENDFDWLQKERSDYVLKLASLDNKTRKSIVKNGASMPDNIKIIPKPGQFIYNNHLGQNGKLFKDYSATIVCAGQHHVVDMRHGKLWIRKMTVFEYESLQTLPMGYTYGVSNSQRKKIIGNGWTVDIIAHILKGLKK